MDMLGGGGIIIGYACATSRMEVKKTGHINMYKKTYFADSDGSMDVHALGWE